MRIRYYVHTNECEKYFAVLNENQSTLIDKRITSWSLTLNRAREISEAQKVLKSFFVIIFLFFSNISYVALSFLIDSINFAKHKFSDIEICILF